MSKSSQKEDAKTIENYSNLKVTIAKAKKLRARGRAWTGFKGMMVGNSWTLIWRVDGKWI